jgi:hypothetical protein
MNPSAPKREMELTLTIAKLQFQTEKISIAQLSRFATEEIKRASKE